jgi:hypothetical protein
MKKPRVFEDGSVTFVVSSEGMSVYVGCNELKLPKSMHLCFDKRSGPSGKMSFSQKEGKLEVEVESRAASLIKWLTIDNG